ncbi:hypothetical protein NKDENANG_00018 [Candidatus Entotheonellaceae bacterium PAL068K]
MHRVSYLNWHGLPKWWYNSVIESEMLPVNLTLAAQHCSTAFGFFESLRHVVFESVVERSYVVLDAAVVMRSASKVFVSALNEWLTA